MNERINIAQLSKTSEWKPGNDTFLKPRSQTSSRS